MKTYYEKDANVELLQGKTVAVMVMDLKVMHRRKIYAILVWKWWLVFVW